MLQEEIKKQMVRYESILSKCATLSKDAIRFKPEVEDIRPAFSRDVDRILHSRAYTRYMGKTQVYSNNLNDNISTRATHVQFVSKVSRTIARALGLNEDLCEAISMGHDLGHVPFGHEGERVLDELCKEYLKESFQHNIQSVRTLMYLANEGKGLNVSLQVLDGVMCHNGEMLQDKYTNKSKTKQEFLDEYHQSYCLEKPLEKLVPMTLEGCVVRISDMIAYIGKDIEDTESLKKQIVLDDQISKILGTTNKEIMNNIILDIIHHSFGKDCISMSPEVYEMLNKLKKLNYRNIYEKAITKQEQQNYRKMFYSLYQEYRVQIEQQESELYQYFVKPKSEEYRNGTSKERMIIDYLAGMTDRFFIREYEKYCN